MFTFNKIGSCIVCTLLPCKPASLCKQKTFASCKFCLFILQHCCLFFGGRGHFRSKHCWAHWWNRMAKSTKTFPAVKTKTKSTPNFTAMKSVLQVCKWAYITFSCCPTEAVDYFWDCGIWWEVHGLSLSLVWPRAEILRSKLKSYISDSKSTVGWEGSVFRCQFMKARTQHTLAFKPIQFLLYPTLFDQGPCEGPWCDLAAWLHNTNLGDV